MTEFLTAIQAALVGLALSLIFVPPVKKLALSIGAVDKPNARKVHTGVKARMGGLAIFAAFWIAAFLFLPLSRALIAFFLGACVLVGIGINDDLRDMPAKHKLLGQVIAAIVFMFGGIRIDFMTWFFENDLLILHYLSYPVTLIWIVGLINAVNLVDGLDGLAAGISAIAASGLGLLAHFNGHNETALLCAVLVGVCLGFLRYNFYPSQLFMGDTGSMFLGYTLAVLSISGMSKGMAFATFAAPILILGIPIFDTLFAILRRMSNSRPVFEADKSHLHHRLLDMGLSHRDTVLAICTVSAIFTATSILLYQLTSSQGFWLMLLAFMFIFIAAYKLGVLSIQGSSQKAKKGETNDEN